MTSLAFSLGVLPLPISTSAGSGVQNAIGISVLGGMIVPAPDALPSRAARLAKIGSDREAFCLDFAGDPDRNRTCDLQIRNLPLYPTELRDQPRQTHSGSGPFRQPPRAAILSL